MNKEIKHSIKKAKGFAMDKKDKRRVRDALLSYIEEHPARGESRELLQPESPLAWFFGISRLMKPVAVVVVLALFIVGGTGISAAAENSLPGDVFYPIKVHVNENIRSTISFSRESKAEWEMERAERRIKEVEQLATDERFERDIRKEINALMGSHVDRVSRYAATLEAEGEIDSAIRVYSRLESLMRVHERVLEGIGDVRPAVEAELKIFRMEVEVQAHGMVQRRADAEAKLITDANINLEAAAAERLKNAENTIREARIFIEDLEVVLGAHTINLIELRLQAVEDKIIEGKAKIAAGESDEAFLLFQEAARIVHDLEWLVRANLEIEEIEI